jgi:putative CocE/NonD family hydrolase
MRRHDAGDRRKVGISLTNAGRRLLEQAPIKVAAFPTSNLFKRGHRIRLDVSSSNFPHFDINPNTGAPQGEGLTRRVARNTVFMDANRASHVVLPLIPKRA